MAALEDIDLRAPVPSMPKAESHHYAITPLWQVDSGKRRAWIDLQNDVTTKDIVLASQENYRSVEHLKRYTTLGMPNDQGRTSNVSGLAVMASLTGRSIVLKPERRCFVHLTRPWPSVPELGVRLVSIFAQHA